MILLLDNYDSFTWNLFHYLVQVTDEPVEVHRNDRLTIGEAGAFSGIVLSPGPGLPEDAGVMMDIIRMYAATIPMLGICLGHQALAQSAGAQLENLEQVLHGVQREITIADPADPLFADMPHRFQAGHYHSWVVSEKQLPSTLTVSAIDDAGRIMALSHKQHPFSGMQFHPESVMTLCGLTLIRNWVAHCHRHQPTLASSHP